MYGRPLLLIACWAISIAGYSQTIDSINYRTYDGTYNNLVNPTWGAAGSNLLRLAEADYADGISAPSGVDRPNPREISNSLFAQDGLLNDPLNLSDFCWVFGQFIDHDLGLTPDGFEPAMISVPPGDEWMDPIGTGEVLIPMMRNQFDPTTGLSLENPRQHPNLLTAYLDGSAVYGIEEELVDWLRTFVGGKLKVSSGNLLPFNTINGEFEAEIDPAAPEMDDAVGFADKHFVAGDVRVNENPLLISFHTLFVREHNRLCDLLLEEHPDWTDEQLYQHARKLVGGIMQAIVFEEWLPAMGVDLPAYQGYDSNVDAGLFNTFTAAAFRLGHTLLNSNIRRINNEGETLADGPLTLREAFFNPLSVVESGGIDVFFKGMATQTQQSMDAKVIDDVRNFLFGPPGAGGLDLASININRGRERGIPDFNSLREAIGLQPYTFFSQLNSDAQVFTRLLATYTDINELDAWVGMLAEEPMEGALFGSTIMEIMHRQFLALRDGDRFYYENDPILSETEKAFIRKIRFHDLIMKNTGITLMQDEVFKAMPHAEICDNMTVNIAGNVQLENGVSVASVDFELIINNNASEATNSNVEGAFRFDGVPACFADTLYLTRHGAANNGVSTFDIILIQKHILGLETLDSPYKLIAADADNNESISVLDLIRIRRVVLNLEDEFPNNANWRFIPANYEFNDPENPFEEDFPEFLTFNLLSLDLQQNFIAIKTGDVNNSVNPSLDNATEPWYLEERNKEPGWELQVQDMELEVDQTYSIAFSGQELNTLQGFQLGLTYDTEALQVLYYEPAISGLNEEHFANLKDQGKLLTSWNTASPVEQEEGAIFVVDFVVLKAGRLSDFISLDRTSVRPEAYDLALDVNTIELRFENPEPGAPVLDVFKVYQNEPNPVFESTQIPFYLPNASLVSLTLTDALGRLIWTYNANFEAGYHRLNLDGKMFSSSGIYYYQIKTEFGSANKEMVVKK